jgi:hypothetical protein
MMNRWNPYIERRMPMRQKLRASGLLNNGIFWICAGALILILIFVPFKLLLAVAALAMIAFGLRVCGKNN